MSYRKLVRDNIVKIIENNGEEPIYFKLSEDSYRRELYKKLGEEYQELQEAIQNSNGNDILMESADLLEVVKSILALEGLTLEDLLARREEKEKERGSFNDRLYLLGVAKELPGVKKVVGTMFFENGRLLIDKPRKRPTYQMIGGSVEEGETVYQAAIRECHEELGSEAIFDEENIEFVMDFVETATSDPNLKIHMYIFKYDGILKGSLTTSDEIADFKWFGKDDDPSILSNTLKNEILPYCIDKQLIK